ncbi:MAG: hypothetical protein QM758_00680 [Armatimonas sp.]
MAAGQQRQQPAVCNEPDASAILAELCLQSLVVSEEQPDGTTRFRFLESVRQFLEEQLRGAARASARQVHRDYYCQVTGVQRTAWQVDADNLEAALESALDDEAVEDAFALLPAACFLWRQRGGLGRNRERLRRVLELAGGSIEGRTQALIAAGKLLTRSAGEHEAARAYLQEAQVLAQSNYNLALEAEATAGLAFLVWLAEGQAEEAMTQLTAARTQARAAGDRNVEAQVLNHLGVLEIRWNRSPLGAEEYYREAQALYEALGDERHANNVRMNRAIAFGEANQPERALELFATCRKIGERLGDRVSRADIANNMTVVLVSLGCWTEAMESCQLAIQESWQLNYLYILGYALWNLTEICLHYRQAARATRLLAFSETFWTQQFGPLSDDDKAVAESIRARSRERIGVAQTLLHSGEGRALSLSEAVTLALEPLG